jgi:nondiscriminating glutamyl-tRNA synthetase
MQRVDEITRDNYKGLLSNLAKQVGLSGRGLYMPLRAALTGKTHGPELEKIFILLGKEKILRRLEAALELSG